MKKGFGRRRGYFTLIEMLVVIAIIGILASMLMPALTKAMDSSRSISCASNLRQQGVAISAYVSDHNGWLPTLQLVDWGSVAFYWKYSLMPYCGLTQPPTSWSLSPLHYEGIFGCPAWDVDMSGTYKEYGGGYGWNPYVGSSSDNAWYPRYHISRIHVPSDTINTADSIDWANAGQMYWGAYFARVEKPSFNAAWSPLPNVGDRHLGGVNVLWMDQHVSWNAQDVLMAGKVNSYGINTIDYYFMVK